VSGTDNRVEHTFVVAVPVERAWQAFTDGAERSRWEAPEYAIDARPGGKLRWRIPPWAPVEGEVLEIEPHRRLVTTEGAGILEGATRVTVTFESVEYGTRITVVQAGFGTGAGWQDQLEGHRHGWLRSLRDLALYLETGVVSQRFFSPWHCDLGMFLAESFAGLRVTEVSPGGWAAEGPVYRQATSSSTSTASRSSSELTSGRSRSPAVQAIASPSKWRGTGAASEARASCAASPPPADAPCSAHR
jgi:uncharacterized protein YndB with AHSA1/START domain